MGALAGDKSALNVFFLNQGTTQSVSQAVDSCVILQCAIYSQYIFFTNPAQLRKSMLTINSLGKWILITSEQF